MEPRPVRGRGRGPGQAEESASLSFKRYKILKIAPTSFFADYGCHVRIYEETRVLQRMGHEVTICTYHTGQDIPGLAIHRSPGLPWNDRVRAGPSLHRVYHDFMLCLKASQVALRLRPHLVHAHLHEGAAIGYGLSRMLRIPLVFDFQGSLTSEMLDHDFIRQDSPTFAPLRALESRINHLADAIITSSYNAASILCDDFGCPPHKVFTVPDSVDAGVFRPRWERDPQMLRGLKQRLKLPADKMVVVYLGLLAEYQGIGKLLEAAALLVGQGLPVHFLIMGFPGEDRYRAQADVLGLSSHVTFTGGIPYRDAPQYLALGDVAVSPKMSETEGNGKLLDYMAVGLPTVTFDTLVAREILGELGVYTPLGQAEALAQGLAFLLTLEPELRDELAHAMRARAVADYSWDRAGERLVTIYDALCR